MIMIMAIMMKISLFKVGFLKGCAKTLSVVVAVVVVYFILSRLLYLAFQLI